MFSLASSRATPVVVVPRGFLTQKACGVVVFFAKFGGELKRTRCFLLFFRFFFFALNSLEKKNHLARKRLVQLEQVDVVHAQPGQAARLWNRNGGPNAHHSRVDAHGSKRAEDAQHGQAALERRGARHQKHSSSAVGDLRFRFIRGSASIH